MFLVDEAHNLVDRARDMYSAELRKRPFLSLMRMADRKDWPDLHRTWAAVNRWLIGVRKSLQEEQSVFRAFERFPDALVEDLEEFREAAERALNNTSVFRAGLLDLYFQVSHFCRIIDLYGEQHDTTVELSRSDVAVRLLCLDPAVFVRQRTDLGKATVYFSATLTPREYYLRLLGGEVDDCCLDVPSPFPKENLYLGLIDRFSTRYRHRKGTSRRLCDFLSVFTDSPGNYLAFFPSYEYLDLVWREMTGRGAAARFIRQEPNMTETARTAFLETFSRRPQYPLVGFAVLGGVFGEGIDLTADRSCRRGCGTAPSQSAAGAAEGVF